jgi:hypothetical protein
MVDYTIIFGAVVLIAVGIALALILVRKRGSEKESLPKTSLEPRVAREFYREFGRSALIEYTPTNRYENATIATVSNFLESGKNVVLLTQAPRSIMYFEGFSTYVKNKKLKVVNITAENPLARPQMFRVGTAADEKELTEIESDLIPVSVNNLEYVTEITEQMESGSVLIFEALTGIILALGKDKKEAVYKFFSTIVEEVSAKDRILVAFLNSGAHANEIVSAYEGLFVKIFKIDNNSIVSLKGEKIKIPIGELKMT